MATDNLLALSAPVSAQLYVGVPPAPGSVYYLGDLLPSTGNGSSGFVIQGDKIGDQAGYTVSSAGDFNRDGFDDILIGSRLADLTNPDRADAGTSYLVFGKATGFDATIDLSQLNGQNGFRITGATAGDFAGIVSAAGDVNGDGYGDLLIGAPGYDVGGNTDAGAAYIVFGQNTGFNGWLDLALLNGSNGFRMSGLAGDDLTGMAVGNAGDVNGDGYADIIIGAPSASPGSPARVDAGAAYIVFGKKDGFVPNVDLSTIGGFDGFRVEGITPSTGLGVSVHSAGDLNGDGFGDVIIGAQLGQVGTGAAKGAAYVIFGHGGLFNSPIQIDTLNGLNGFRINGFNNDDMLGFSANTTGDFNGDGFDDLVIGVPGADPGNPVRENAGSSYVIYGAAAGWAAAFDLNSLNGNNGFRVDGLRADDGLGTAVSPAGDVNGDGFDDLLLGAPRSSPGVPPRAQAGETYVLFGRGFSLGPVFDLSTLNGQNGFRLEGISLSDSSGWWVSAAGDVNGDGFDDLAISAPLADPGTPPRSAAGQVFIFFGRNFSNSADRVGGLDADTLTGTIGGNVMVGGQKGDTLLGNGGADVLRGGQGDDILAIGDMTFVRLVGGRGLDTVRLDGAGLGLDLIALADNRLTGIERIDLTGTGNNVLTLDYRSVVNLSDDSNELIISRNDGDIVNIGDSWTVQGYRVIDGQTYYVFKQLNATLVVQAVREGTPWQNPANPLNVDNQFAVEPID
ncbi:MAG TPA: hypothetical protein PLV92_16360, partial [Pirellulaceae bacterium]|nr:hypothetical protein [Pirellulaceae bacterium]